MTSKRDQLVKALANLAANHSEADWLAAADRLEEIARLARSLAEIDRSRAKNVKSAPASPKAKSQIVANKKDSLGRILSNADITLASLPITRLKELAVEIGIKDELAKTKDMLTKQINAYLDTIDQKSISNRLSKVRYSISDENFSQEDTYNRWVKLITKRQDPS